MNYCIVFPTVFYIFHDNIAHLEGIFAETHFKQLYIFNFFFDIVILGAHKFLSKHILILINESLLRTIEVNKYCGQINFLILDSYSHFVFFDIKNLPLFSSFLILIGRFLINILFGWNSYHISCQPRWYFPIFSHMRNYAS